MAIDGECSLEESIGVQPTFVCVRIGSHGENSNPSWDYLSKRYRRWRLVRFVVKNQYFRRTEEPRATHGFTDAVCEGESRMVGNCEYALIVDAARFRRDGRERTDAGQADLSPMGVTGEDEESACRKRIEDDIGVMGEEEDGHVRRDVA